MSVTLGKYAGFCGGVKRAVILCERAARSGRPSVMLGPIIHNDRVVEKLREQGVGCVHSTDEVPDGADVIIRSHGESRAVYEALEGHTVVDTTCPKVAKIHALAQEADRLGRQVLIIGRRNHPEVTATAGWCQNAVILETAEELENWLLSEQNRRDLPIRMLSQTTANKEVWKKCVEIAKKGCTNAEIFDTICDATYNRQSEAEFLAEHCDVMVVIGDHKSSNTRHLAELCEQHCSHVFWIEQASELPLNAVRSGASVGITAGASTPGWIIKEVVNTMSEEKMEIESGESFAEMFEASIKTVYTGEKVKGTVVNITPTEIQVELGTKHTGSIPLSEFSDDPSVKAEDVVKVGDEIEAQVMRVNDQDGIITLSKKRLDANRNWEAVEEAKESGEILEGLIREENKGGVVANIKGVRVFIPASQTGLRRGEPMTSLVGTTVRMKIIEFNRQRRRVVGSIRAVSDAERKAREAEVWANIEKGKKYDGVVKSLTAFGAFVDIGGVDGMVHITELSWSRLDKPADAVKVGDQVEVYVIDFDADRRRISLSMKDPSFNPWDYFVSHYDVGDVATVKVVKLMSFGAFAEITPGVDGLIHISQIADRHVEKPGDELTEGETIDVKITHIDDEKRKVSLSRRALLRDMDEE